jgi:hypothetical protein
MSIRTTTLFTRATTEVGLSWRPPINVIGDGVELNKSADLDEQNMELSSPSVHLRKVSHAPAKFVKKIKV